MRKFFSLFMTLSFVVVLYPLMGKEKNLTGRKIMEMVDNRPTPKSGIVKSYMILLSDISPEDYKSILKLVESTSDPEKIISALRSKGYRIRVRRMKSWGVEPNDNLSKAVIKFLSPEDVKGIAFLNISRKGEDPEQYLYLPSQKRVRQIVSTERYKSFQGSDFSYEDLEDRYIDDYKYKYIKDQKIRGKDCYIVKTVRKDKSKTQYSKAYVWVRKDINFIIKTYLYDKKGKLMKKANVFGVKKIKGYWTGLRGTMYNVQKRTLTILLTTDKNIKYDVKIPNRRFTKQHFFK